MRIACAIAVAAFLAAPAVAQVTIATGSGDAARHHAAAEQDRAAGHANMGAAHQEAALGNYHAAARDQDAARADWHASHRQEHAADRDAYGGVTVRLGQ